LAKANRHVTNPILIHLARRPPFAALTHVGRVTGRTHRIPVNAFPTETGFVIPCTYGRQADWVRNVTAAERAILEYEGKRVHLSQIRLTEGREVEPFLPLGVKLFLHVLRVHDYMVLERDDREAA
jgi:deazaflavin-dependent oxidoreductase (nitroreductase family)